MHPSPGTLQILIIGGTRFIGPPVVRRLAAEGHALTLLHRGQTRMELPAGVEELLGDRQHLADFTDRIRALAPDVVLDMAPLGDMDARPLVEVCRGIAGRLVAVSSMDVYLAYGRIHGTEPGPAVATPMDEDAPLRQQLYPYRGESPRADDDPRRRLDDYDKILMERIVLDTPELPGTVLRLPMVYGPGDYQHRLFPYLKRIDDGRPVILLERGIAGWRLSRGFVDDVARAIALAVVDGRAAGRVYNVCEADVLTEQAWIEAIGAAAGWQGRVLTVDRDQLPAGLQQESVTDQHLDCDSSRIRRELGYEETLNRREALERTIAWERAHPPAEFDPQEFDYAAEDQLLSFLATDGQSTEQP